MGDPVQAAIEKAEAPAQPEFVSITMSSGRPAVVAVPPDITERELLDLAGFVVVGLGPELERRRQRSSGIAVVSAIPPAMRRHRPTPHRI